MSRRTDGRDKRAPLAEGNPRRMTDAKCAFRKMTDDQRRTFLDWLGDEFDVEADGPLYDEEDDGIGHARLTPQEAYDHDHPPMRDDPMATER